MVSLFFLSLFQIYCLFLCTTTQARTWDEARALAEATTAQLTLDEKVGILIGKGQFGSRCVGDTGSVSRLNIPNFCMNDGPAGLRATKGGTGFPAGINAASTFSRRLMRARGVALGEEFRGKGVRVYLGPAMDIMRSPKAGRAWESFGPEPWLNGESAYETIMGIQSTGVMACAKHLIANNQEHWRYGLSADVDDRTLHEIYWWPFLRSIEADVASVMCAYNRFNQTSSCHNKGLLTNLLRKEGGFEGFVVSDWGATHDSVEENVDAGLDMEQPGDWIVIGGAVYGGSGLKDAVNEGRVDQSKLNRMVTNVLTPYYKLGQDGSYPAINFDAQKPDGSGSNNLNVVVRTDAHTALAREIAVASAVLLKNRKSGSRGLPLGQPKTVAVIGQDAKMPTHNCDMNKCNDGTMVVGWGSGSYTLENVVPPIDAITNRIGSSGVVTPSLSNNIGAAVAAARGKDVAIVFANAMSGELGLYDVVVGNMGDRNDLALWWGGGSMIEAVATVNENTIAVIHSVGPVSMSWSDHPNITGIIYAGAPGEQTGPSLVDVLWGLNPQYPSGRLPFAISDNEADYPASIVYNSDGFPTIRYTEKLLLDYRYMESEGIKPRFDFGFGLSYTTFQYFGLEISPSDTGVTVVVTIENTGAVPGTEIPQLYLGFPANAGEPPKVLRGFDEVFLQAGSSSSVTFNLNQHDLRSGPDLKTLTVLLIADDTDSIWDVPSQSWVRPSGTFTAYVGSAHSDIRLQGTF
ncbi:glycoside hydrolase family 3 protein [Thelephora ganbajun]|uniref:Glycoside hydrolase family 3 protein n=1 Tax=Thelephora ganbajun TaxID=370292 RepID=A0ACB6ZWB7_THEGA|nr:glycoside hydrolase family 3 protein [Thelephora ganbajun]